MSPTELQQQLIDVQVWHDELMALTKALNTAIEDLKVFQDIPTYNPIRRYHTHRVDALMTQWTEHNAKAIAA